MSESPAQTAAQRVKAFLDWWVPQMGDVIAGWLETRTDGETTQKYPLLASDLRALLAGTDSAATDCHHSGIESATNGHHLAVCCCGYRALREQSAHLTMENAACLRSTSPAPSQDQGADSAARPYVIWKPCTKKAPMNCDYPEGHEGDCAAATLAQTVEWDDLTAEQQADVERKRSAAPVPDYDRNFDFEDRELAEADTPRPEPRPTDHCAEHDRPLHVCVSFGAVHLSPTATPDPEAKP